MIRTLRFVIVFWGLILPLQAAQKEFQQALDMKMPSLLAKYNVPGAEIVYISKGEVAWSRAYGTLNLQTREPLRPGLVYQFASCGKVLTAWGIMHLMEQGKIALDVPANRYLKRYQIQSSQFDPNDVTIRRLLSHTAGLTVHGFIDYAEGERLPSLVEVLNGENQSNGRVYIKWQPGSRYQYSGGGFVILQMIIEDITGEPFADYMQREITNPLGMTSLRWTWTPAWIARAAIPYYENNQPVGYRQLASQAIGSEISTVSDFAQFVVAAVLGPKGEPVGRGVLKPETVHQMLKPQPGTGGTAGLGYQLISIFGEPIANHEGYNTGWRSGFFLDLPRKEGLVFASSSANAPSLEGAIQVLWFQTVLSPLLIARILTWFSVLLGGSLVLSMLWLRSRVRSGQRTKVSFKLRRLFIVLPWTLLALIWGCVLYSPLLIPVTSPEAWPMQTHIVMALFLAWIIFSIAIITFPKKDLKSEELC